MTTISELQPLFVLRQLPNNPTFDLVLRWVPKITSWLPGPNDRFWLTITISVGHDVKYLYDDGLLYAVEPTGDNRPNVTPNKTFMLDPPRTEEVMPFVSSAATNLQKWLQGKRPTNGVNCAIPTNSPFPYATEGFGVCHLLAASQPSDAANRIREKAIPMFEMSLSEYESRGGSLQILLKTLNTQRHGTHPTKSDLAKAIAESLAIYLVSRTFEKASGAPKEIIPAINSGLAELTSVLNHSMQTGGLSTSSVLSWKGRLFTFVEQQGSSAHAHLGYPHSVGTHAEQIELRYAYAAILVHCLSTSANWRGLNQESKDAEQSRNQIRLRALHGGTLIDFSNDPLTGWKGSVGNSSEIVGLGRTFSGFSPQEVATWDAIAFTVTHEPGITKGSDILLPSIQTIAISTHVTVEKPASLLSKHATTEKSVKTVLSSLSVGTFRMPNSVIRMTQLIGQSVPPTPPRKRDNGAKSIPRVNFDLMQTDITQPIQQSDQVVPPRSKQHVGFNTGDGKVEVLMSFDTDGTTATRSSGGFNLYVMWRSPPFESYFKDWRATPGLSKDDWLAPKMNVIQPFLLTRRYSYLRDLRNSLKSATGTLPNIQELMLHPPKQTIFPRPDRDSVSDMIERETPSGGSKADESGSDPNLAKMPNVVHEDELDDGTKLLLNAWSGDLRKGMKRVVLQPNENPQFLKQWDPAGGIDFDWTPELDRDGHAVADGAPQPYRIWITTSDFFDQESYPVPVYCHDSAFAEPEQLDEYLKWIYRPVRRAPIESPLLRKLTLTTVSERTAFDLKVEWETPYYNSTSTGDGALKTRPPKRDLVSYVVVFRKMINDRGDTPKQSAFAASTANLPSIPDLPQWAEARSNLITRTNDQGWEGWEQYGDHHEIDGHSLPANDDAWNTTVHLSHYDRGYDYLALVGVQVKDSSPTAQFFAPNVLDGGRRLQGVKWNSVTSKYELVVKGVQETPRVSFPERTNAERLPNSEEPRGVTNQSAQGYLAASPVLPPPSVQRDLVLTKLLTHRVNAPNRWWYYDCGQQIANAPRDDDWKVAANLNVAQIAMIESALARTVGGNQVCNRDYANTRRLMAEAFKYVKAGSTAEYVQHMTVGFRGIKWLKWTYAPLKSSVPAAISIDEAEATVVRVWQVRVQSDPQQAAAYASVRAAASLVVLHDDDYRCRLSPLVGDSDLKGIENIVCQHQPALVRVEPTANSSMAWYGNVVGVETLTPSNACPSPPGQMRLPITAATLRVAMGTKPVGFPSSGSMVARLYTAQPLSIVDQKIDFSQAVNQQQIAVPIGGGPAEIFGWWIGTLSAKTVEAGLGRRVFAMEQMEPTTEPQSPQDVRLAAPSDPATHKLDTAKPEEFRWLPEQLRAAPTQLHLEDITPRTVLTWRPYAIEDNVGIRINRKPLLIAAPKPPKRLASGLDPWVVIKTIELLPDSTLIETDWIDCLQGASGWLLGNPVEHSESDSIGGALEAFVLEAPAGSDFFLSGVTGVKVLDPPATTETLAHAGFVDYSRDNARKEAMTVDYEYQYELVPYLDLGAHVLGSHRYLPGKPSDVTHPQRPENPPISVKEISRAKSDPFDWKCGPFVKFVFVLGPNPMSALRQLDLPTSWRYRLVVRRRLPYSLRPTASDTSAIGWEDVGSPLSIWPNTSEDFLFDYNVERKHPDFPIDGLEYQIIVQQFAIFENTEERPVRKQESADGLLLSGASALTVDLPPDDQTEVGTIIRIRVS